MSNPMNEVFPSTECTLVALDTPCVKCNYNLRGLDMSGRCPECSTPVIESGDGLSLRYANVKWLKRMYVGLTLLPWGVLLVTAQSLALGAWTKHASLTRGSEITFAWVLWYCGWIYQAGTILLFTAQEPRLRFVESVFSLRRLLRWCASLIGIGATVFFVAYWYPPLRIRTNSEWIDQVVGLITLGVWLVIGLYLSRFAHRMECCALKEKTISITVGLSCIALLTGLITGVAVATGWNLSESSGLVTLLLGVIGIAGIVYLVRYVCLLFEYKREFRRAYRARSDSKYSGTDK